MKYAVDFEILLFLFTITGYDKYQINQKKAANEYEVKIFFQVKFYLLSKYLSKGGSTFNIPAGVKYGSSSQ